MWIAISGIFIGVGATLIALSFKIKQTWLEIESVKSDADMYKCWYENSVAEAIQSRQEINSERRSREAALGKAMYYEQMYKTEVQKNAQRQQTGAGVGSQDKPVIAKALKKAMFATHPDRTGKDTSEEFMQFNNLYKKYK